MPKANSYRLSSPSSDLNYVFSYKDKLICKAMVLSFPSQGKCLLQWRAVLDEYMKRIPISWNEDGEDIEYEETPYTEFGATLAETERPLQEFYDKNLPIVEWVESILPAPKGYTIYRGPKLD